MFHRLPAVLVVDDDEAICGLVCEGLAEDGYTCDAVSTANDALSKLRNQYFDVALLDIRLPGESGIDLLKKLWTFFQTPAIIMMTAVKDLDTVIEAMKMGASDYIVKPFTIDKLSASISTVLKNSRGYTSVSATIQTMVNISNGEQTDNRSLKVIHTIAYGVDAQVDSFDFHSKIVTERTAGLAQQLGLPAKEIETWTAARNHLYSQRDRYISSISSKLERNPIAQSMLGLTRLVYEFPELDGKKN